MIDRRIDRSFRITAGIVAAFAAAAYLAAIHGYPRVVPFIHQADPANLADNIDAAMARGDTTTALALARYAVKLAPHDPDTYTRYGEILVEAGDPQAALNPFEYALGISGAFTSSAPPTPMPFFHADARAGLGSILWRQGDAVAAVTHFELARPHEALLSADLADYHKAMFDAYAAIDAWSRAIEFADPTAQRLGQLDREGLVAVITAAEAAQKWDLLGQAGRALLAKDTGDPAGQYAVGRAQLAQGKFTEAIKALGTAAELGHLNAPFFHGNALVQAGETEAAAEAFRAIPGESLYRPFALAHALRLLKVTGNAALAEEVREQLETTIAEACPIPLVPAPEIARTLRAVPEAIGLGNPPAKGNRVPVTVRWQKNPQDATDDFTIDDSDLSQLILHHETTILDLQWAANAFPLSDFERFEIGLRNPPGWFDPDTPGPQSRDLPVGEIAPDSSEPGRVLRITCESGAHDRAMVNSPPVTLAPGELYVLAARVHAPDAGAVVGWEFLGDGDQTLATGFAVDHVRVPSWTWHAVVTQARHAWTMARAVLGVDDAPGTAEFDHVLFLELNAPDN